MEKKKFRSKKSMYFATALIYILIGIIFLSIIGFLLMNFYREIFGEPSFDYFFIIQALALLFGIIYSILSTPKIILEGEKLIISSYLERAEYSLEDYNVMYGRSKKDKDDCLFLEDRKNPNLVESISFSNFSQDVYKEVKSHIRKYTKVTKLNKNEIKQVEIKKGSKFILETDKNLLRKYRTGYYIKYLSIPFLYSLGGFFKIGNLNREMSGIAGLITVFIFYMISRNKNKNICKLKINDEEIYIKDERENEVIYNFKDLVAIYMSLVDDKDLVLREIIIETKRNEELKRDKFTYGSSKNKYLESDYLSIKDEFTKRLGNNLIYPYNERKDLR